MTFNVQLNVNDFANEIKYMKQCKEAARRDNYFPAICGILSNLEMFMRKISDRTKIIPLSNNPQLPEFIKEFNKHYKLTNDMIIQDFINVRNAFNHGNIVQFETYCKKRLKNNMLVQSGNFTANSNYFISYLFEYLYRDIDTFLNKIFNRANGTRNIKYL